MSLRETWREKQRAIVDLWKVVKSIPARLEQCEAHLDAVRRAVDEDYARECRTRQACRDLTRKIEMDLFRGRPGDPADGSVPAPGPYDAQQTWDGMQKHLTSEQLRGKFRDLAATVHARPAIVRPPEGWMRRDDDG